MPDSFLEPEYAPHLAAWKAAPGPDTTDRLLKAVNPIMNEAMRTYGGQSATSPLLRSKAKLLTLNALQRYDPSRAKLRTHLITQLQGLRRHAAREEQAIRMPEQLMLDRRRMLSSENELRDRLGRDPSDTEIADHSGLSPRRMTHIREIPSAFAEGTLTREGDEGASIWQPAVKSHSSQGAWNTWLEIVHHDLDPIDQVILGHKTGLHGRPMLSNQAIAKKVKLSPGAVSQRANRIQEKLNMAPATGVFGD